MEKEDVMLLIQLLYTMQEMVEHLEEACKKKDNEKLMQAKKEIFELQRRINELV